MRGVSFLLADRHVPAFTSAKSNYEWGGGFGVAEVTGAGILAQIE